MKDRTGMTSCVSRRITEKLRHASWIRKMFETGNQLRAERGPENVYDFSLGNPEVEPPTAQMRPPIQVVAPSSGMNSSSTARLTTSRCPR